MAEQNNDTQAIAALDQFSHSTRLKCAYLSLKGLKQSAIAEQLGISIPTVSLHLKKFRADMANVASAKELSDNLPAITHNLTYKLVEVLTLKAADMKPLELAKSLQVLHGIKRLEAGESTSNQEVKLAAVVKHIRKEEAQQRQDVIDVDSSGDSNNHFSAEISTTDADAGENEDADE